jgi:hypothetical protein
MRTQELLMECQIITVQDDKGRSYQTRLFYNDIVLYTRSFPTQAEAEIEADGALDAALGAGWIRVIDG